MNLLELVEHAGIVGCGGAGFPTHVKLKGNFEYLIVNGAECEPLLRTDRYLMRHKAKELIETVQTLKVELGIPRAVFALKGHYRLEVEALRAAIQELNAQVEIKELESFYPAGDEQTIVYEVTGRVVPPAGLPSMVGAVVDNVATIYCIYQALRDRPFIWKYLTVTGEVKTPSVLKVPVGTSYAECIELAGGALCGDFFVISGGPMMGKPLTRDQAMESYVTKTTSGILVLPKDGYHDNQNQISIKTMINRAKSACIQCTQCTQLCPRHLLGHPLRPHAIMRKMAVFGMDYDFLTEDTVIREALLCCECGICETYACPMGLQPRKINSMLKKELGARRIRYERSGEDFEASSERECRKVPSKRAAARVGVLKYYDYEIDNFIEKEPKEVVISLRMNIGAPSKPIVKVGQMVLQGDLIACISPDALGANIHASISGMVTEVSDVIRIEKELA